MTDRPSDAPDLARGECANCGAPTLSRLRLYCGERCRQIAELVRYARRKLKEGTYERPDIAEAITLRRGLLVAGGFYDKEGRAVSAETRQEILARSNGRCENCGREFGQDGEAKFTVQHCQTDKGFVLKAWCYRCNMDHALSGLRPVENTDEWLAALDFESRVRAPKPLRLCDDPDNWPATYRTLQRAARSAAAQSQPPWS